MYIKVKVKSGAKKEKIEKKNNTYYTISVCQKAERNLANHRVCEIIASLCDVTVKNVRIISGHHSPSKILSVNLTTN